MKYSKEQIEFFIKIVPGHTYKEIIQIFFKKFEIELNPTQVKNFVGNNKLNTGKTGQFPKGHEPANKGTHIGGWEPTQFKKGSRPHNYKPVGSERISGDGYLYIKIVDPNKWRGKHLLTWEKANGLVPKGHVVIFGDGNRFNFDLDNLILVTRGQLAILNHKGLIQESADLTRTGIIIADIYSEIVKRRRKK